MKILLSLTLAAAAFGAAPETVAVVAKTAERTVKLPGEFLPFQFVELHARVSGYVDRVSVDRGSAVRKGQVLVELSAPEMKAQIAEARGKEQLAASQKAEAEARQAANEATLSRLRTAAQTPGAIAANEIEQAEKSADAARAAVASAGKSVQAAHAAVDALADLQAYLKIEAPFDGIVTERLVHPGTLAGPTTPALLRIEQNSRLRLVVALPEAYVGAIVRGAKVPFTVPAYGATPFSGTVARIPQSLDAATRTMPVELDVQNPASKLAPGMYPEVVWPVRKPGPSLFVPPTAIVTTTERTFVIRATAGKAEWVNVKKGPATPDLVEVTGALSPGDLIVKRATDEIRNGAPLQ